MDWFVCFTRRDKRKTNEHDEMLSSSDANRDPTSGRGFPRNSLSSVKQRRRITHRKRKPRDTENSHPRRSLFISLSIFSLSISFLSHCVSQAHRSHTLQITTRHTSEITTSNGLSAWIPFVTTSFCKEKDEDSNGDVYIKHKPTSKPKSNVYSPEPVSDWNLLILVATFNQYFNI